MSQRKQAWKMVAANLRPFSCCPTCTRYSCTFHSHKEKVSSSLIALPSADCWLFVGGLLADLSLLGDAPSLLQDALGEESVLRQLRQVGHHLRIFIVHLALRGAEKFGLESWQKQRKQRHQSAASERLEGGEKRFELCATLTAHELSHLLILHVEVAHVHPHLSNQTAESEGEPKSVRCSSPLLRGELFAARLHVSVRADLWLILPFGLPAPLSVAHLLAHNREQLAALLLVALG